MSLVTTEGMDDAVLPFAVEALDIRGRAVRLGALADAIIARHAYPPPVARVLGEALALTALLGSSLKDAGRFQLQTKTHGVINMVVVDYEAGGAMRGYARFDAEMLAAAQSAGQLTTGALTTGALLGDGHLAMTIEQGIAATRYQGVVPLAGQSFEEAAHTYFQQSEQIPTRIRLAVGEMIDGSASGHAWRAGGIMVQFLPTSPERQKQADIAPGDAPEGHAAHVVDEDDAWIEARSLIETVEDHELLDPMVGSERLLYRLFHERGARVFEPVTLRDECRCSQERIMTMLKRFTPQERRDMIADDGRIAVTCEFCSRRYDFEPAEVEAQAEKG